MVLSITRPLSFTAIFLVVYGVAAMLARSHECMETRNSEEGTALSSIVCESTDIRRRERLVARGGFFVETVGLRISKPLLKK